MKKREEKKTNPDYILLRVNLADETYGTEEIALEDLKRYIGGKGLGSKYLLDEVPAGVDPLSPANKLIFAAGPLTATTFPTANRYGLIYKSPLTGGFAESYSGGGVVHQMRAAGYFVVIIEGKARRPTYLDISGAGVEFNDASDIWGKLDTLETYEYLKANEQRDLDIVCIGRAGENLVRIANVQNNKFHSAGRCGPGAVMGSKLLKAIAFHGTGRPRLNEKPEFKALVKEAFGKMREHPDLYGKEGVYPTYGTPIIVTWANALPCFPTRYFTKPYSEYHESFDAHALVDTILKKRTACWNCPFGCGKYVEVEDGPYKCALEGPEYETIYAFGGLCDVRDIRAIAMLNEYCDRAGIDTISAGSICGLVIEAKRRGRLPEAEELDIDYNNPEGVLSFLKDIVDLRGLGADAAQGTRHLAEKYGLEDLAMHVKGLDFAGYDPRAFRGFTLSYGVSPEGPTHLRSVYHGIERNLPDRLSYEKKAERMIPEEDRMAAIDSLVVCKFIRGFLDWDLVAKAYNVAFDEDKTASDLREIAAEFVTLARRFNAREGFSRKDDYMPPRAYAEDLTAQDGSTFGLDREKYDKMLDEYYELRGWSRDGIPPES
ncbi:MAG: aldehyde ferredoxin oxidoreductase family protein [Promethearchaeota archaeon]